jgi:hypothetical protein
MSEYNRRWRKDHPAEWQAMKRRNERRSQALADSRGTDWPLTHIARLKRWTGTDAEFGRLIGRSAQAVRHQRYALGIKRR